MQISADAIVALKKLDKLADEMLLDYVGKPNIGHEPEFLKLSAVKSHVHNVLNYHTNPHAISSVQGSLETLREVVKYFKLQSKLKH